MKKRVSISAMLGFLSFPMIGAAGSVVDLWGGTYGNWPTVWTAIPSLNDSADAAMIAAGKGRLDFAGDVANPGAYFASDSDYFYVRMRMNIAAVTAATYADALFVYVDRVGTGNADGNPDFAFVWDSKSSQVESHGLEMQRFFSSSGTWATVLMDDVDGQAASKAPKDATYAPDINYGTTGEGYIRSVDGQPAAGGAGDGTAFIDFAVAWSYLQEKSSTGLAMGQTWRLAMGSKNNSTDHGFLTDDVAGGGAVGSAVTVGWSGDIVVGQAGEIPEAVPSLGVWGFLLAIGGWRAAVRARARGAGNPAVNQPAGVR